MVSANALVVVLSLLGGFYFFSNSYFVYFYAKRTKGQELLFYSALWGIVFLVPGRFACWLVANKWPAFYRDWHNVFPIPGLGTVLASALLAVFVTHVSNLILDQEYRLALSIQRSGSELERLLLELLLGEDLLLVTLDTGKVYVGQVATTQLPERPLSHIEILPMASGYRKAKTHEIKFQFDYAEAWETRVGRCGEEKDKYRLILPIERIVTASSFDPDLHVDVQATRQSDESDLVSLFKEEAIKATTALTRRFRTKLDE